MGGGVIELGLADAWEEEPPPPRRWPPRLPRWLLPAVVTVATLLSLGAAVAPQRWDPVLSLRDPNTRLDFASDDTVFLSTPRTRSGRLQAYRPGRTAPLWTVNFPGGHPVPHAIGDPGVVTLSVFDSDPNGQGDRDAVQGRDARTGRLLWTRPGWYALVVGTDTTVLTDRRGGWVSEDELRNGVRAPTLEAVDRRTGQARWTRTAEPGSVVRTRVDPDGYNDAIVELHPDGRLRITDPSTGASLGEHRLALVGVPLNVEVTGGLAMVFQRRTELEELSVAYDLATGAERWRNSSRFAGFCGGRYLCTSMPDRLTITELDTGEVRYQGRAERHEIHGDRLVVSSSVLWPRPGGTELVDLRTGRRLNAYPGWIHAGSDRAGTLLVRHTADADLMIANLDVAAGRFTVIGRASAWTGAASCVRGKRYLGCIGLSDIRIWPLPR